MTLAEMEALVEDKLGGMRHLVERQLRVLEERLRPGERLVTVGVASRRPLLGGELLLAATDQRLLWLSRSSSCEELEYEAIISVISEAPAGAISEISLVTARDVHTFVVMPVARAAEIVAAVAARIGEDRGSTRRSGPPKPGGCGRPTGLSARRKTEEGVGRWCRPQRRREVHRPAERLRDQEVVVEARRPGSRRGGAARTPVGRGVYRHVTKCTLLPVSATPAVRSDQR